MQEEEAARELVNLGGHVDEGNQSSTTTRPTIATTKKKRGGQACLACRRIKIKCRGWTDPPCLRCSENGIACVFAESRRGRRSSTRRGRQQQQDVQVTSSQQQPDQRQQQQGAHLLEYSNGQPHQDLGQVTSYTPAPSEDILVPGSVSNSNNTNSAVFNTSASPAPFQAFSMPNVSANISAEAQPNTQSSIQVGMPNNTNQTFGGLQSSDAQQNSNQQRTPDQEQTYDEGIIQRRRLLQLLGVPLEQVPSGEITSDMIASALRGNFATSSSSSTVNGSSDAHPNSQESTGLVTQLAPQSVVIDEGRRRSTMSGQSPPNAQHVASNEFFLPGHWSDPEDRAAQMIPFHLPEMLKFVSTEQVHTLFNYYYKNLHHHFAVLIPEFHTPYLVARRSPFLLTVCAVSAKFCPQLNHLASRLGHLVKNLCFDVARRGSKTIEFVQGSMLISVWSIAPPPRHFEDITWIVHGLAKSTAQDISLDRSCEISRNNASQSVQNEYRIWLYCYFREHELSSLLGRSPSPLENKLIRNPELYLPIESNGNDYIACIISESYRILSRTIATFQSSGDGPDDTIPASDCMLTLSQFESQITQLSEKFSAKFPHILNSFLRNTNDTNSSDILLLQKARVNFTFHYSSLVVSSFALNSALKHKPMDVGYLFNRCLTSASSMLRILKGALASGDWLRHAPDSIFVCTSYAVISLLRLSQPKLSRSDTMDPSLLELLRSTVDLLERKGQSDTEMVSQYASFLKALIDSRVDPFTGNIVSSTRPSPRTEPILIDPHVVQNLDSNQSSNEFTSNNLNATLDPVTEGRIRSGGQLLPPQWSSIDASFGTLDDLMQDGFWDKVLMPGFKYMDRGFSSL